MNKITFKSDGYDPFIDFLKGVCILWVVLTHAFNQELHDYSLFCLWGDMAVPMFLLIQCIHVYKKDDRPAPINWRKIWSRILVPFISVELIILMVGLFAYYVANKSITDFISNFFSQGGIGRGSYYPKMYIEFAFMIPLFYPMLKRNTKVMGGVVILFSCIFETFFSYYDYYVLWQWICFRYIFIIVLGYIVAKKGVVLNMKTCFFSGISIIAILVFQYSNKTFEPLFYNNPWTIFHWPIYCYVAFLLLYIMRFSYRILPINIKDYLMHMGKYSYEIFLFQMLVFFVTDLFLRSRAGSHGLIFYFIYVFFVTMVSITPVVWYKHSQNVTRSK